MLIKVFALGFIINPNSYLRDFWNILDFLIIITFYLSLFLDTQFNLAILRTFRFIRPLRSIQSI